jgi:hypothetical protein
MRRAAIGYALAVAALFGARLAFDVRAHPRLGRMEIDMARAIVELET